MVGCWPRLSGAKPDALEEVNMEMQSRFAGATASEKGRERAKKGLRD